MRTDNERFNLIHETYLDPPWPADICSLCEANMREDGATGEWRCTERCEKIKADFFAADTEDEEEDGA